MQRSSFPRFDVTPEGLIANGNLLAKRKQDGTFSITENTLSKFCGNSFPFQSLRYINRAGELMAKVKDADWNDRTPHDMNNMPVLAQIKMNLALASPMPYPFYKYSPDQPRVPAGNPDGGQWTSDGGGNGSTSDRKGEYQVADAGNIRTDASTDNSASKPAKNLSLSDNGLDFIKEKEGFSSTVYPDTAQHDTIGYGHKLTEGESYLNGITEEQAAQLLADDVSSAEDTVQNYVKVNLTQSQFDALTSLTYNIGSGRFKNSTLLSDLNSGDYNAAADQFLVWNKQTNPDGTKTPNSGLTSRRKAERSLFLNGTY